MLDDYRSNIREVNRPDFEDLSTPEKGENLNFSESNLDSRQPQFEAITNMTEGATTMLQLSSDQQEVGQSAQNLPSPRTLSSSGTSDSDSKSYEYLADKSIADFVKPIPTRITSVIAPGQPISLKDVFLTPEPSLLGSEASDGTYSSFNREDSAHFILYHDRPEQSPPVRSVGVYQEGSILSPAMNTLADEAVETYYKAKDMGSAFILSDTRLDVSNSLLVARRLLKLFRCQQIVARRG